MQQDATTRETKKLQRSENLVSAAYELFALRGFQQVTVDEIAEKAGLSRRTFFRYYPTKEAVVFHAQMDRIEMFREWMLESSHPQNAAERVMVACLQVARYFMSLREELNIQQKIIRSSELLVAQQANYDRHWRAVVKEGIARHLPSGPEADRKAGLLAGAAFGVMLAILDEWYDSECESDLAASSAEGLGLINALLENVGGNASD